MGFRDDHAQAACYFRLSFTLSEQPGFSFWLPELPRITVLGHRFGSGVAGYLLLAFLPGMDCEILFNFMELVLWHSGR